MRRHNASCCECHTAGDNGAFMDLTTGSVLSMSDPPRAKLPFMEGLAVERVEVGFHSFLLPSVTPQLETGWRFLGQVWCEGVCIVWCVTKKNVLKK